MPVCLVHPGVETEQICVRCRQPFCDACLAEIMGGSYCTWCKSATVQELQLPGTGPQPPVNPGPILVAARVYDLALGMLLAAGGVVLAVRAEPVPAGVVGVPIGVVVALLGVLHVVMTPLLRPGHGWAWGTQIGILIADMLVCLPVAIPMLIFWMRPEVRERLSTKH